ncbi:MAG: signal recognition particle-docking protein FtsY [Treponema sp.]|jgi:fused signal recognition particle receptor|nr:signal recognition particle-docking protein FtsY [Treponema sp.]
MADRQAGANSFASRFKKIFGLEKKLSDEMFDDLSDLLVEGDFGAAAAYRTVDELRLICKKEKLSDPAQAQRALAELLEKSLCPVPVLALEAGGPLAVILLLGVNGAGKTTTAAKLADRFRRLDNRRPLLAAADTFRAAASEQLKIHGERLGARVVAHKQGGDSAAVVYDAIEAAQAGGGDLIIVDTAGRMHTKSALVEELKKIDRVAELKAPQARRLKFLILDATTGRNALAQAEIFHQAVALDGVVLTKFDSSARGGAAFSLSTELGLPVVFVCHGENYGDIGPFEPGRYAKEFIGLE